MKLYFRVGSLRNSFWRNSKLAKQSSLDNCGKGGPIGWLFHSSTDSQYLANWVDNLVDGTHTSRQNDQAP
jgi:hypothetical protein